MKTQYALLSLILLVGCGGGGGGGSSSATSNAIVLSGTAAMGAPVSNGRIRVLDAAGQLVGSATTTNTGTFSITLTTGATAPFMLELSGGTYFDATISPAINRALTKPLHSVANNAGITNITGLTEMVLAQTLAADPATLFSTCQTTPTSCTLGSAFTPKNVQQAHNHLLAALQNTINQVVNSLAAGTPTISNFFTQSFAANSNTSMDALLDNLKPTVNVVGGEPQMTLIVSGIPYVFAMNTMGSAVPATGAPIVSNVVNAGSISIPNFPSAVAATQTTVLSNQSSVAGATTLAQIRTEYLTAHNKWRATVGVPALSYSIPQEAVAQAWVNNLQAQGCPMIHSTSAGQYGENLFASWGAAFTPTQIVDTWASEGVSYIYASNTCATGKTCGHYTQVIWRNTTSIGCATASCPTTNQYVTACQYSPPGNYVGQKPY